MPNSKFFFTLIQINFLTIVVFLSRNILNMLKITGVFEWKYFIKNAFN